MIDVIYLKCDYCHQEWPLWEYHRSRGKILRKCKKCIKNYQKGYWINNIKNTETQKQIRRKDFNTTLEKQFIDKSLYGNL